MMIKQTVTEKRPARLTGELINEDYALQLIAGFKQKFPEEVSKLFIKAQTIFDAVKNLTNVSGIRFMYGMESVDDPGSKVILLIPCNDSSTDRSIPNTIVQPQGYLNNKGKIVGLKRTWELLYNHAIHSAKLMPDIKFHKIVRGVFFGIDSLTSLLTEYTQADGINYHFGYDETVAELPLRYKPVLNPLHKDGRSYPVFEDVGTPCPPYCPHCGEPPLPPCESCFMTMVIKENVTNASQEMELDTYRGFRDQYMLQDAGAGPLVEMYYYVSPALIEAMENTGRSKEIYAGLYHNQVSRCNQMIEKGNYEDAKVLFEQTMDDLMNQYLFKAN